MIRDRFDRIIRPDDPAAASIRAAKVAVGCATAAIILDIVTVVTR